MRTHRRSVQAHKRTMPKRTWVLAISLMLVALVGISVTIAYLMDRADPVTNTFIPGSVTTAISETNSGNEKTKVSIVNTGNVPAYIRAAIVVTWQDAEGNVYGKMPVPGTDYVMTIGDKWDDGDDGFYYWPDPVNAGDATGILITSCKPGTGAAPDGYSLCVEVLGSGIQSEQTSVVKDQWGVNVSVSGSTISK